ncbi:MAG: hypothetical protein HOE54_07100, partial [Gammaproteobacteria bacterium]|nr:hypothetical protein [Gammaproteobacteria bacterium]
MKLISLIIVVLFTLSVAAEELTPASSETGETAFAYLITSADSEYVTTLHILNRSTEALSVTATLYDSNGDQLGLTAALNESIQGLGRISLGAADLEQLLGAPAWRGPALLKVEGSAVFELMTTLDNPTGLTTSTNCATTESVHHVLPGISYIRFINQGEKTISNIRGRLVTENGELIGLEELQL